MNAKSGSPRSRSNARWLLRRLSKPALECLALILALTTVGCATTAQTKVPESAAAGAVQRHFEARGGEEALLSLIAVERMGGVTVFYGANPTSGTFHNCVAYPDRFAMGVDAGVLKDHDIVRHDGVWECGEGFVDCVSAHPQKAEGMAKLAREVGRELLFEVERWIGAPKLVFEGTESVTVEATLAGGPVRYTFSRETGLLMERTQGDYTRRFGDWRDVEGVKFPFSMEDFDAGKPLLRVQFMDVRVSETLSPWCAEKLD